MPLPYLIILNLLLKFHNIFIDINNKYPKKSSKIKLLLISKIFSSLSYKFVYCEKKKNEKKFQERIS